MYRSEVAPIGNLMFNIDRNKNASREATTRAMQQQQQILPSAPGFHGESFMVKTEGSSSHHMAHQFHYPFVRGPPVQAQVLPSDVDTMKAKIVTHPQYCNLLDAFISCQKVKRKSIKKIGTQMLTMARVLASFMLFDILYRWALHRRW